MAKTSKKLFRKSENFSSRVRKTFAKPSNFPSKIRRVIPKPLKVFRQRLTNFTISQQIFVGYPRFLRQQSESYRKDLHFFSRIQNTFTKNPKAFCKTGKKCQKLRKDPTKCDIFLSVIRKTVTENR